MEKIVDFSKLSIKKIRELIVFTALIVVALWKFDVVLGVIKAVWGIIFPFALGGAIAFVINVPMSFLEKKLFGKAKEKGSKAAGKLARPISLLLTIVLVVGVIVLVALRGQYVFNVYTALPHIRIYVWTGTGAAHYFFRHFCPRDLYFRQGAGTASE